MKFSNLVFVALATLIVGACSNVSRSRNLGNPDVAGKTLAQQVCSNCHGLNGVATSPNVPNLAAQQKTYLVAQLTEFRDHSRRDPFAVRYMWGISRSLTDKQIAELAEYYAAQKPASPPTVAADEQAAAGRAIFTQGLADKGVPACSSCHGRDGSGNATFPRLAGQHSDYLVKQLANLGTTDDRPGSQVMKPVASKLRPAEIESVAKYLQAMTE